MLKNIRLDKIKLNTEFFYKKELNSLAELEKSIKKIGLVNPLLVAEERNHYVLLGGTKRFLVLKKLGYRKAPAQILRNLTREQLFLAALEDNVQNRIFNQLEKALLFKAAFKVSQKIEAEFFEEVCRRLLIPFRAELIRGYIKTAGQASRLPLEIFRQCLEENRLHLQLLPKISALSETDIRALAKLIKNFSLNSNQTTEVYNLLEELSQKENQSIGQLIKNLKLWRPLKKNAPSEARIRKLKEILLKKRYPLLSKFEGKIQKIIKKLRWPPDLQLKYPAFFENSEWLIQLKFKNFKDFLNKLELLINLAENQDFPEFLDKIS